MSRVKQLTAIVVGGLLTIYAVLRAPELVAQFDAVSTSTDINQKIRISLQFFGLVAAYGLLILLDRNYSRSAISEFSGHLAMLTSMACMIGILLAVSVIGNPIVYAVLLLACVLRTGLYLQAMEKTRSST